MSIPLLDAVNTSATKQMRVIHKMRVEYTYILSKYTKFFFNLFELLDLENLNL